LDGTLIDSIEGITKSVNFTLKEYKHPPVGKEYVSTIVNKGDVYLLASALRTQDKVMIEAAIKTFRDYYFNNCYAVLYEGVSKMLKTLFELQKKMAVISNKPYLIAERQLQLTGLIKYINILKADDGNIKLKPHPDSIEQILKETGSNKNETLIIGDSCVDIIAGKTAGVLTCGVTYGNTNRETLMKAFPDFLIDDIRQLVKMF